MGGNAILWLAYFFLERLNTFFLRRRLTDCNVKCLAAHVTFLSPHLLLLALLLALTSWLASHSLYIANETDERTPQRGVCRARNIQRLKAILICHADDVRNLQCKFTRRAWGTDGPDDSLLSGLTQLGERKKGKKIR